jgi:hypothetical protein
MADASMAKAVMDADLKSLELLHEYTKFHIGLYLTLASAFIAVASLKKGEEHLFNLPPWLVWLAMAGFMLAGLAGGVIASSITQCYGVGDPKLGEICTSSRVFLEQRWGPWKVDLLTGRWWTWIEHTSFWTGLISAVCAFFFPRKPRVAPGSPKSG